MASDLFFNKMENDAVYTKKYRGCLIEIYQDVSGYDQDFIQDEALFLTAYHRDFDVSNDIVSKAECQALATGKPEDYGVEKERIKELEKKFWHFGLEAYIHSGVSLALSYEGNFVDRQWDVSQLGLVFVSKEIAKTRKTAREKARELIELWNHYLSGNVYGFMTIDEKNGIDIESIWNFVGDYEESEIFHEAKESIN